MTSVKSYSCKPKYLRDNGLLSLNANDLPLPEGFETHESSIVSLPARQAAGNHRHPRQEAYLCLDERVQLHWRDETGNTHVEQMLKDGNDPQLFIIPPWVPHAIVNTSDRAVTLVGYADGPLENTEPAEVVILKSEKDKRFSEQDITQAATLLSELRPGLLPFDIFHEVTRLVVTPIIEIVPLRKSPNGKIEVLLLPRSPNDPIWPGQLHVPGTVIRASDTPGSFDIPIRRILSQELMDIKTSEPVFVKNILHHSGRGMEASQIFWVEVQDKPIEGVFYEADNLPESIVKSQLDFIPDAVAHFLDPLTEAV